MLNLHRNTARVSACVLALSAFGFAHTAASQAYPNKPIRIYAPYAPGGATDILARLIGQKLFEDWKQPVIVEAKPGAGGNVGTDLVAKSAPDGYTLLMGASGPLAINATLYAKLPYDPLKDLAPVIEVASVPLVLAVTPSLPAKNPREFIALLKARPGQFNYASAGPGTPQHLTAELFKYMTKLDMTHIPYTGSGPAIIDVIGGQVPLTFESMIPIIPQIKGGKLRALAVTSAKRSALLPNVPTLNESGVPGFEATAWYGVVAPANVPRDIIAKLNEGMLKAIRMPDVKQRLDEMGSDPVAGTPEQFGTLIRNETSKWGAVIKAAKVKLD